MAVEAGKDVSYDILDGVDTCHTNSSAVSSWAASSTTLLRPWPRHYRFRESTSLANGTGTELASPTIEQLDPDLQQLIRTLTAGDEVIFRRAKDLYEEQGNWFKLKESAYNDRSRAVDVRQ